MIKFMILETALNPNVMEVNRKNAIPVIARDFKELVEEIEELNARCEIFGPYTIEVEGEEVGKFSVGEEEIDWS